LAGFFIFGACRPFVFSGASPAVTTRFRRGGELRQAVPSGLEEREVLLSLVHSAKMIIFT